MTEKELTIPFDPLRRSEEIEGVVMRGERRLYHRFRPAPYYGGIATADAVGCSFLCAYCWNYFRNLNPGRFQNFYSPQQVASRLLNIARKRSFRLFRISGAEPILGRRSFEHLVRVVHLIFQGMPHALFILETNGFFLGAESDLIDQLRFSNLRIRVCLKGTDERSFELITGAKREFFPYPLKALKRLEEQGTRAWPALMRDLFTPEEIAQLENLLDQYGIQGELELEALEAYPFVIENMKRRNVRIKYPV
ncbi:MAG: radical SAM protein [Candidatus Aminicenantales bacterium]